MYQGANNSCQSIFSELSSSKPNDKYLDAFDINDKQFDGN